jgi:hypothetical protein
MRSEQGVPGGGNDRDRWRGAYRADRDAWHPTHRADRDAWQDDHGADQDRFPAAWEAYETVKTAARRNPSSPPRPAGRRAIPNRWPHLGDWTSAETAERQVRARAASPAISASRWAPTRLPALPGAATSAPRAVTLRTQAFCEAPTAKRAALPPGVTLIPGSGRRPLLERSRPRSWSVSGAAGLVLATILVLVVFRLSGPADSGPLNLAGLAADIAGPAAGGNPTAASGSPLPALGLWQADIVEVPVLGGGGASAPGIQAPGTANAPAQQPATGTANAPAQSRSPGTASAPAQPTQPPAVRPAPTKSPASPPPTATPVPAGGAIAAAPFAPWPPQNAWMSIPGYTPYAVSDPRGDPMAAAFGQCTWWAQRTRMDENLRNMGNARYWAGNAALRGYRVGATPARGATVVFQPGVQGAGWAGHVAHVLILYPGGWFLISEMNAYGNGGGWGRVSFRYAHTGPGVAFIY